MMCGGGHRGQEGDRHRWLGDSDQGLNILKEIVEEVIFKELFEEKFNIPKVILFLKMSFKIQGDLQWSFRISYIIISTC